MRSAHLALSLKRFTAQFDFAVLDRHSFEKMHTVVRQPSPLFCSNLDLEYIVFSFCPDPYLKNPEDVEVSPLGNFSYSRFSKWLSIATEEV